MSSTSAWPRAAARSERWTRRCSWTLPRTDRRGSTPWSGCLASTRVLGSDAPYATTFVDSLGAAAARRIAVDNPRRALGLDVALEEVA